MEIDSSVSFKNKQLFIQISPIFVIANCGIIQMVTGSGLGTWSWLPTMIFFWAALALIVVWASGVDGVLRRYRAAKGHWGWSVAAIAMGLLSTFAFIRHHHLLNDNAIIFAWIAFALINPWLEESYWRGVLMDATQSWGKIPSLLFSSFWFIVSHPLIWGAFAISLNKPAAIAGIALVGIVWGLAYQRTGSLRWTTLGHILANLLGLAALVLMNQVDLTAM